MLGTPVQPGLSKLPAPGGIFSADQLSRAAAHRDALALAEPGGEFLQVVATEPVMAHADGAAAGFVAVVEHLVDLTRHLAQHFAVLVLDTKFEGFDRVHGFY